MVFETSFHFHPDLGKLSSNQLRPKVCFAICLPSTILHHEKNACFNEIVSMMGEISEDFFADMLGGGKVGKTRQLMVCFST